jgi:general secretion pathway protein J
MTQPQGSEYGFTLIETMVSLLLIAFLAMAGSTMLVTTLNGSRQLAARGDSLIDMQVAHAIIRDDIVQMVERLTAPSEGFDPPLIIEGTGGGEDGYLLRFTRSGWQNPGGFESRGDLQRLEYGFEEGKLIRRAWARPDAVGGTPVYDVVLLEGLSSVRVRYLQGQTWLEEWYVGEGSASGLPEAIEVTFEFSEEDSLTARFMTGSGS